MTPESRRRIWIFVGLATLVVGILLYTVLRRNAVEPVATTEQPKPISVRVAQATYGVIETVVDAHGLLTPAQDASARVATPIAGHVLQINVREGDMVTAGQLLAVIDNRALRQQAAGTVSATRAAEAQAAASVLDARATAIEQQNNLNAAKVALAAARADRDFAVNQARITRESAQTALTRVSAGARPQEIAQAEQAALQARATRDRAAIEAQRQHFLFERGVVARRAMEDADTALAVANAAYASAQQQLSLVRAGARPEDIHTAQLAVEAAAQALAQVMASGNAHVAAAEATLRQAETSGPLRVAARQRDVNAVRATGQQRSHEAAAAQITATSTILRAPLTGTVTRRPLNRGDMADPTTPVVEITDTRHVNLMANLSPEDGQQVRPGQLVRVHTTAAPDVIYFGTVLDVGQIDPLTNFMSARIVVANPNAVLKVGTFAAASIILATDVHAIVVPKSAVITRNGKPVVFVVGPDQRAHQRTVVVGGEQHGLVSIRSGVAAGEVVIIVGQYALADGMAVNPTASRE